jgi:hypothetical protein
MRVRATAMALSAADYEKPRKPEASFDDFMRSSPWIGLDLTLEQQRSDIREIGLD